MQPTNRNRLVVEKVKIAPSVLAADFTRLGEEVKLAVQYGADQIHIDVMDGVFVPNITMGPLVVNAIRRVTDLPLDVHLMIVEPERHLEAFAQAGASALTVHLEACPHLHRTLQMIRSLGLRAGVAVNPHSPAVLLNEVVEMVDIVLVMTVNPGFGGQVFLPETLPKLRTLHQMLVKSPARVDLAVDGGIDAKTTPLVLAAGANVLVAGYAVFEADAGVAAGMAALQQAIADYQRPAARDTGR
jgi:ribulose-phosphate 3-epimerase